MQKEILKSTIEKYYLNGLTEVTKFIVKNKSIFINFTPTEDKSLVGRIIVNNTDLADTEIGIYNTSQLLKLIKILDHTIEVTFNQEYGIFDKMLLRDNKYDLEFYLADLSITGKIPKIKEPNSYESSIKLDEEFIKKFINAKKSLGDIKRFTVETKDNKMIIVIGDDSNYSNKIKFSTPVNSSDLPALPFSANIFHEILEANREANNGTLEICKDGLIKLFFNEGDIESTYFLVRLEK